MDTILVEYEQSLIEIEGEPSLVSVEEMGVEVISVGEQGMAGPPGSGAPLTEDLLIGVIVPTEFILQETPILNSVSVFINGLRQAKNAFTVSGSTVSLPGDLLLTTDDLLSISYTH